MHSLPRLDRVPPVPGNPNGSGTAAGSQSPPESSSSMIGPSPSYIPNDYNDVQSSLYARGGYAPPTSASAFSHLHAALVNPAAGYYGTEGGAGGAAPAAYSSTYNPYHAHQNPAHPPTASQHQHYERASVSPPTGYEGWKEASESTYPTQTGYPRQENSTSGFGMNTSPNVHSSTNSSAENTPYHPHKSSFTGGTMEDRPVYMSPQNTLSFPLASGYALGGAMTGQEQTPTPESSYFSSPPQAYENTQFNNQPYTQQPILFSPDQKPLAQQQQYAPMSQPQNSSPESNRVQPSSEPRKIAGTGRAQRASITGNGAQAMDTSSNPSSLRPGGNIGAGSTGSGFSTRSAPPASTSAMQMQPPPNPYSNFNSNTAQHHHHARAPPPLSAMSQTFQAMTPSSMPFASPTTAKPPSTPYSNPKKRIRHSTSQSLSVPRQIFGHHHTQDPQPSILQSLSTAQTVMGSGQQPIRFDTAMLSTAATFDDSSSSDDSDDDVEIGGGGSSNRSGKAGSKGKAGKKHSGRTDSSRLPGACKNCKRLKMKCVFESEADMTCKRCRDGGKECKVEGRKQRVPSNKRELLMNQLREKDKLIDALLRSVHNPSKVLPVSFRAASPSAVSREESNGKAGQAPPQSATTSVRDIYAWLATSTATRRSRSPRKSDSGLEDSSDEQEEAGRAGIIDIDGREASLPVSESSLLDSISQRGAIPAHVRDESHDRLEVASSNSSGGKPGVGARRPSTGELPRMHSVPDEATPLGLLADLNLRDQTAEERDEERAKRARKLASMSSSSLGSAFNQEKNGATDTSDAMASVGGVVDPLEDEPLGPANKNYWRPGPAQNVAFRRIISERNPPELLANGILTLEDVDKLFKLFYDRLNVFLSILDPVIHTPADVFARSPFLFTVVCAVSSRYYTEKPVIYNVAMHYARVAAAMALVEGGKSVEVCQAYLIMGVYPLPARRWEEDRAWLYLRLAIGMATDLSLHIPSSTTKFIDERHEREILNRTRTWIICFNLDRSGATQFGKPPSIKEDTVIRRAPTWYNKSAHNHCYDIHMVAYTSLLKIVGAFLEEVYSDPDSPTGLNKNLDFVSLTTKYDAQVIAFRDQTAMKFLSESDMSDPACHYRNELLPFLVNYSRLVMFSFGFQQAIQRNTLDRGNMFVAACIESASNVLKTVIEVLAPSGYLRYAADGHFVFAAFASAFLLKLLRAPFTRLLETDQQTRILSLVNRLIKTLGSPEVAVDERHTPKIYSRFLEGLLLKRNQEIAEAESRPLAPPTPAPRPKTPQLAIDTSAPSMPDPSEAQLLSPTIQVQGPDEELLKTVPSHPIPPPHNAEPHLLGHQNPYEGYAYSTTASSTIDAPERDTATQYSTEDVLMQGDENWIATMGALDNPAFWTNAMLPGFNWPSPPESMWQAPISADMNLSMAPQQNAHSTQQYHSSTPQPVGPSPR